MYIKGLLIVYINIYIYNTSNNYLIIDQLINTL